MPSAHDDMSVLLGPAALGLLDADEQAALDRHLGGCALCRAELADLTGVAGRLQELDGEQALLADLPGGGLRAERVLRAVAAERGRGQRRQVAFAAAAAVVVLLAGVVSAGALADRPAEVPLEAVAVSSGPGVTARADLVAHTWGVEIKLAATGLPAGEPYTVQVRTRSGQVLDAGAFLGTGRRTLLCNLNTAVLRPDAASFTVLDRSGEQVLEADLQ